MIAIPGKNWPDRLTRIRGRARFRVELQVHSGAINCGIARLKSAVTGLILPSSMLKITAKTSTDTMISRALKHFDRENPPNPTNKMEDSICDGEHPPNKKHKKIRDLTGAVTPRDTQ